MRDLEVKINMNDSSTLVTVAMLSTLLSEKHSDYLDLISPFIMSLLPKIKGEMVNKEKVIKGLEDNYGFLDFPSHVLEKILERNTKVRLGYLKKQQSSYFVQKPFESSHFETNRSYIQKVQRDVITKLQQYLIENTKEKNVTPEKTRDMLIAFLEKNGLAVVDGVSQLKLITSQDYENYNVARFILKESEAKSDVYLGINEVVRGFFVYKSIYYFSNNHKMSIASKLKGTTLYFDTRLLIEALGYNTHEGKKATRDLLRLVYDAGGQVKTFTHLKDEVAGILTKYARDPLSRNTMRLEYFDVNRYNEIDIIRLRSKLEDSLNRVQISIEDAIIESDLNQQSKDYINTSDLTRCLQIALSCQSQPGRIENDVTSIASIYSHRKGCRCYNIETCKSILVTTNPGFTQAVNSYYKQKNNGEINLIIDDIDITALLWLRSWDKKSTIPSDVLLENAYAACQPSPELIATFAKTVTRLQKEDQITSDEALLLRTEMAPREELLKLSQNDSSAVSDSMVIKIRDTYAQALTDQQNREINDLSSALESEKKKKFTAIDKAEELALDKSEIFGKLLKIIAIGIFVIMLLVGLFASIISVMSLDANIIWKVVLVLIGFLGLFDVIKSRNGWINKKINLLKKNRFDSIYNLEIQKINHYFDS